MGLLEALHLRMHLRVNPLSLRARQATSEDDRKGKVSIISYTLHCYLTNWKETWTLVEVQEGLVRTSCKDSIMSISSYMYWPKSVLIHMSNNVNML
jgi:hypothetical protein